MNYWLCEAIDFKMKIQYMQVTDYQIFIQNIILKL